MPYMDGFGDLTDAVGRSIFDRMKARTARPTIGNQDPKWTLPRGTTMQERVSPTLTLLFKVLRY